MVLHQQILKVVLQGGSRFLHGVVLGQRHQQLVQDNIHILLLNPDPPRLEHPYELDFRWRQENRRRTGASGACGSTDSVNVIPDRDRARVLNDAVYLRHVQSPRCDVLDNGKRMKHILNINRSGFLHLRKISSLRLVMHKLT